MSTQTSRQTTATAGTAWSIDPDHTLVSFAVKHMMVTTVRGRFHDVEGTLALDPENPAASSLEIEIDAGSIDTGVPDRDAHLRSADFFDVEQHPTLRFRSRRVEGRSMEAGARLKLVGDLTIRGVTREVALDVTWEGWVRDASGRRLGGFRAGGRIDRRDFGLTWNQALEAGGVLVSHEVKIEIEGQVQES